MHKRWQIDWKIGIKLENGECVHLASVRDPFGAVFIGLDLYVVANRHARVREADVRTTLRRGFAEWGIPDEIQTDGEPVLNSPSHDSFPSKFELWLIGLGIRHRRIRPGVATDDAEVERAHHTINEYALRGNLGKNVPELRQILQQAGQELNREYPSRAHGCNHRPPIEAHPELLQPKRSYDPQQEALLFDIKRVDAYLAGLEWERKVGRNGQINMGGSHETYLVGREFARQVVLVKFDPQSRSYVAFDPQAHEIRRWPARHLSTAEILNLSEESLPDDT